MPEHTPSPAPPRGSRGLMWAALSGIALLFIAASVQKIWAGDFWGQLRTGEWILQHRAAPAVDEYTWTRAGTPYIEVRWLYEVVIAIGWRVGPWLLCLGQAVLLGAMWVILARPSRAALRTPAGQTILALAIAAGAGRWVLRPELVTDLMVATFLVSLEAASIRRRIGRAWLLVLAQVVWTNSHSVFALGPILAWTFAGSELVARVWSRARAGRTEAGAAGPLLSRFHLLFVALAAATTGACFVNPYFSRGALYALEMYREAGKSSAVGETLGELRSPFAIPLDQWTWDLWAALVLALAVVGTFVLNARRAPLARALVFAAACYLAAGAQRNAALLAIMGTWAGLANLRDFLAAGATVPLRRAAPLAYAAITLSCAALAWYIITDRASIAIGAPKEFGLGVVEWDTPRAAADFLVESGAPQPIFNTVRDGHYLGWRTQGRYRVFIDGRTDIAGDELVRAVGTISPANWDQRAAAWKINTTVLTVRGYEDLVAHLARSPDWALVHLDHKNVVFVRTSEANQPYIAQHRIDVSKPWTPESPEPDDRPAAWKAALGGPSRAWYVQGMAETFLALGAIGNADQYLVRSLQERPGNPRPLADHAAVLRFAGQRDEAERIWSDLPRAWRDFSDQLCAPWLVEAHRAADAIPVLTRLVDRSPRDGQLRVALADAHFQSGGYLKAREHYERALALGAGGAPEWMKLGYACDKLGDMASAAKAYQRSLDRDPRQHQVWGLLGNVRLAQGDRAAATQAFQNALRLKPDYEPARKALESLTTK